MRGLPTRILLLLSVLMASCTGIPDGIEPVDNFTLDRYLGRWYEIARLDHSFEHGLSRVTADYSLRPDGGVKVVNRGFDAQHARWEESVGKAYFVQEPNLGYLKVSFFGPFYGSYVIFELDKDYNYAMVSGPDRSYLWLLSRTPTVDSSVKTHFLKRAGELGFDTEALIFVEQSPLPGE